MIYPADWWIREGVYSARMGQARMGIRYQELAAKGIDLPTGIEFDLVAWVL